MLYWEVRFSGSFVTDRALLHTQLDLHTVTAAEVPVEREFAPAEIGQGGQDVRPIGPVRFEGRLQKHGEGRYRLTGRLRAVLAFDCGRCLEPFTLPVDTDVDLTYVPHPVATGPARDEEIELSDDDLTTAFYRDQVLNLADMVREQFYLAMPMRPLCRDDCRGLCPHCGTNLNVDTCQCTNTWEDPRLAGLRTFIEKQEG
jgi:uncharacterized protein